MNRAVKVLPLALLVIGAVAWTSVERVTAGAQTGSTSVRLLSLGTGSLAVVGSTPDGSVDSINDFVRGGEREVDRHIPAVSNAPARVPADHVPAPEGLAVASTNAGLSGFNGLSHWDQRTAGTGAYAGTQFSLEPPDQALCVGNGFVVEAVNTAVRVRNTSGTSLTGATALNQFFGLAPEVIRTPPAVYGDFTSDPKCYYDPDVQRFFLTLLQLDVDPATGNLTGPASVLIAVSQTSDPRGSWYRYKLNTTNDGTNGTPSHPSCPCFGDQPLIGADANGFYITTNEFSTLGSAFNGAQIYAMSKWALASGTLPSVVLIGGPIPLAEGIAYSVQPATTPAGAAYETAHNGTEYFVSSLEFTGGLDNRIAVWALTNTASLKNAIPAVSLASVVVPSQVYGMSAGSMPGVEQADGPRPLAAALTTPGAPRPRLELLDANDDRMNQAVYVGGRLYAAVDTVVKTANAPTRNGIAYFVLTPTVSGSALAATMTNQGYISVNRAHVVYPSVAMNSSGLGAIAFTFSSKDGYPSAAYAPIDASGAVGDVHIAAAGVLPEDGFTGYAAYGGSRVSRWGDYSAAVADESGHIWMATEFIPGGTRTVLANWGTYIARLVP